MLEMVPDSNLKNAKQLILSNLRYLRSQPFLQNEIAHSTSFYKSAARAVVIISAVLSFARLLPISGCPNGADFADLRHISDKLSRAPCGLSSIASDTAVVAPPGKSDCCFSMICEGFCKRSNLSPTSCWYTPEI